MRDSINLSAAKGVLSAIEDRHPLLNDRQAAFTDEEFRELANDVYLIWPTLKKIVGLGDNSVRSTDVSTEDTGPR